MLCSCDNDDINFSYSPAAPRCGQTITFSNTSTKGDNDSDWEWTFGDGATSTIKSTTKVYKQAGIYTVTLTLDGKKYQRATKEITVYDSIPTFTVSTDSLCTFNKITFTALTYNPYGQTLSYQWIMPEDAVITDSTSTTITAYFTLSQENKEVTLITTLGSEITTTTKSYTIYPTAASSLYIYHPESGLLQQKLYELTTEEPNAVELNKSLKINKVKQMIADGDYLYLFNMSDGTDGAIYAVNLIDHSVQTVIVTANVRQDSLYASGLIHNGFIYFTSKDNKAIYRVSTTTRNATFTDGAAQLYADATSLVGFEPGGNGLAIYGNIFYLAANNGIYRFQHNDINSGSIPTLELLSTPTPQNIKIDPLAGKVYTIENTTLMVRNIDGTYAVEIDTNLDNSSMLTLNNSLNCIVYSYANTIFTLPLLQTKNNTTSQTPIVLTNRPALSLALDGVER